MFEQVWEVLVLSPPIPTFLVSCGQGPEGRQNEEAAVEEEVGGRDREGCGITFPGEAGGG